MAALLGISVLAGVWFYTVIWEPHRKLYRDEAWLAEASTMEVRSLCHHIIGRRPANPHDAFLHLRHVGNAESVPLLIRALRWQNSRAGELQTCTTVHCVDALRSLTGQDFGYSPEAWTAWWEETGRKLPAEHFHPRERHTLPGAATDERSER